MLQHPQKYTRVEHADLLLNPENRKAKKMLQKARYFIPHTYIYCYVQSQGHTDT